MGRSSIFEEVMTGKKPLTMEEYMEIALYHQDYGYYMNPKMKIGKNGDFYTSSSVSDIFGRVWADYFVKSIAEHDLDPIIVEFGGGSGNFAKHVRTSWKEQDIDLSLTYIIVEKSPYHRKILKKELKHLSITIMSSIAELKEYYPFFKGIVFANEVLDAFPIRIFQNNGILWKEKMVIYNHDEKSFFFDYMPLNDQILSKNLDHQFQSRLKHYELEVSFQMMDWLNELYGWANQGTLFFFVDYGYKGEEWDMKSLKEGSIRGYYKHQMQQNPLSYPGEMDITYHVDWDCVINTAGYHHIETLTFDTQSEFLLKAGLLSYLNDSQQTDPFSVEHKRNRAIRSFLLDSTLASGFQVIQQKKRTV